MQNGISSKPDDSYMKQVIPLLLVGLWVGLVGRAEATPFYSVGSGHACDTCHIEPLGWKNPVIKDRKCTLDCVGCHVTPTGGGMRTVSGRFYGEQVLPMFGERPADGIDPRVYLPKGFPSKGRYSLKDGFSGWWPGKLEHRTIRERYGHLEASNNSQVGADLRAMAMVLNDKGRKDFAAFPMEALFYGALFTKKYTLYVDAGLNASSQAIVPDGVIDYFWVREAYLLRQIQAYNSYLRVGRFSPPYGWRIPDHTAFVRSQLFNQFRQVYGLEVGTAPNEGWGNLALYWQGIPGWPGDDLPSGFGATAQGGIRRLGYQLGGSAHYMRSFGVGNDELSVGPMWAVNYYPFVYLGELDYVRVGADETLTDSLIMLNEVRYDWIRGIAPKARLEWVDQDLGIPNNLITRILVGVEFNPYKYLQLELDTRVALSVGGFSAEVLFQVHSWLR